MKPKNWTNNFIAAHLLAAGALVATGAAVAQPGDGDGPPRGGYGREKAGGQCQHDGGGQRGHRPPPFEDLDRNGDGKLSADEAADIPPVQHRGFGALDTDGDGYLSKEELPPPPGFGEGRGPRGDRQGPPRGEGYGPRGEGGGPRGNGYGPRGEGRGPRGEGGGPRGDRQGPPSFSRLDTNGDGKLSADEADVIPPVHEEGFETFDANKDGYLTEEELPPPPPHRGEGPRGERPRGEGPRGEGPRGEGPRGEGGFRGDGGFRGEGGPRGHRPPPFEDLDTNGDGKLSRDEASDIPPVQHQGFDTFDDNGDGYLTRQELPPPPNMRGHGRGPNHARAEGFGEVPLLTNIQPKAE